MAAFVILNYYRGQIKWVYGSSSSFSGLLSEGKHQVINLEVFHFFVTIIVSSPFAGA